MILIRGELTKAMEARLNAYLANKWDIASTVDSDGDGIADAFPDPSPVGEINEPKQVSFAITYSDKAGNAGILVTQTGDDPQRD